MLHLDENLYGGCGPFFTDRDHQLGMKTVESQQKTFDWSIIFFAFFMEE